MSAAASTAPTCDPKGAAPLPAPGGGSPEGALLVDVQQVRELADAEYRIGDRTMSFIMESALGGAARLGRVYAVVRLGRRAFETACEASGEGRTVQWTGQRVRFVYRGETQLFIQVRDKRSVGVREDPLVGEAAFPLRPLRANIKRGIAQKVDLPIVRGGVVAGRVSVRLLLEQVKGYAWLRRYASDTTIQSPEMPVLAALAEAHDLSGGSDDCEETDQGDEGESPSRTTSCVSVLDEFGQYNDDWSRIKAKRGLHALRVRILSVSDLADPQYRFGDLTKQLVRGRDALKSAVYAEVQLGELTARTPTVPGAARVLEFPDVQDFTFAYRGDGEIVVRVSNEDGFGNLLLGVPLIGEAVLPLDAGLNDCKVRSTEIPIFLDGAKGRVALEYGLAALSAAEYQQLMDPETEEPHEGLAMGRAAFAAEGESHSWGEEYALLPLLGPRARRALVALGRSSLPSADAASDADADGILRRPWGAVEVARAGLPDQWKAFAWYHCSGAAARTPDAAVEKQLSEVHDRYHSEQSATFSFSCASPKSFAWGWEGRAPLFDQGCLRVEPATLEDVWRSLVASLSTDGLDAAKRILWTLNRSWHQKAQFSPWLPALTLALLQFCEEGTASAVLTAVLERATLSPRRAHRRGSTPAARCFLFTSRDDLSRASAQLVLMAHQAAGAPSMALRRLADAGYDVHGTISSWLQDCLASMLPARAFLRLVAPILCEGWEAPGRLLLAMLGRAEGQLDGVADAEALGKQLSAPLHAGGEAVDSLFAEAFALRLAPDRHPFGSLEGKARLQPSCAEHEKALCWPCFPPGGDRSHILSQAALVRLFSTRLPEMAHFWRPYVVFSTEQGHGYSVSSLVTRCARFAEAVTEDAPMLFVVKASTGDVAGAYSPVLWRPTGGRWLDGASVDATEAFLFSVSGTDLALSQDKDKARTWLPMETHLWQGHGGSLFSLRGAAEGIKGELLFGGDSEGQVALSLDDQLKHGSTGPCAAFASPPLLSARDFEVAHVEVLALVEEGLLLVTP